MNSNTAIQNSSEVNDNQGSQPSQAIGLIPVPAIESAQPIESLDSFDAFGSSCRICRWNRSNMEILQSPCLCKGTGYIHLQCLKRWIMQRRSTYCEICNTPFSLPVEKHSFCQTMKKFIIQCAAPSFKQLLMGASLVPLSNVIFHQMLQCLEDINPNSHEHLIASEVLISSCSLLTSSVLFFRFFEYMMSRILLIRTIVGHWWTFGDAVDFPLVQWDSGIVEVFWNAN
ncbi:E3 ubiquitin-protein ligase MARCHF2 isoform X2 [Stomoxys calcitrans]|uniref:RING-CH-type domain-containing protein n=1 Tax=Stomoxys calcitrans TaxID=35570 RepID=A0A1I8QCC0_STOCA|nr:E3 ubiquitin-protein ligase MARCHF2 isoform X2 [Stomoxys calcitrans]